MSDNRFDKIDDKLEKLADKLSDLEKTVATGFAVYNKQLEIHIEATNQNREAIKFTNKELEEVKEQLEPIEDHVKFLKTLGKVIGAAIAIAGTLSGIAFGIAELLK